MMDVMTDEKIIFMSLLKTDGTLHPLECTRENLLSTLQEAVEGYIELAKHTLFGDSYTIVLNEDGLLKQLPINPWIQHNDWPNGHYVGNIVLIRDSYLD